MAAKNQNLRIAGFLDVSVNRYCVICGILTALPLQNPLFFSHFKMEMEGFFKMLINFPATRISCSIHHGI
jgi:hypothetical protein